MMHSNACRRRHVPCPHDHKEKQEAENDDDDDDCCLSSSGSEEKKKNEKKTMSTRTESLVERSIEESKVVNKP